MVIFYQMVYQMEGLFGKYVAHLVDSRPQCCYDPILIEYSVIEHK
jgi:hypothetical protein